MRLTFYGAAQTVTGSQHMLEMNGQKLLLECGFYQGRRRELYERNQDFPFTPSEVDAVILSHAHIDHSGNLPNLVKSGYHGPIYATPATAHLANIMLLDSGHIQESDAHYVNKKRARTGRAADRTDLIPWKTPEMWPNIFEPVQYGNGFNRCRGSSAHLVDAGHILGSAAVVLDIEENGRKTRLWFSGDIGRRDLPLLRDPVLPKTRNT